MLARVVRAMLAAVAWSGLWAAVMATEPRLWTQPTWQSREIWTLQAKADGSMRWGTSCQEPHSQRWVGLDGATLPGNDPNWRDGGFVSTQAPATTPINPGGPRAVQVAPAGLAWEIGGLFRDYTLQGPRESWYLVTDAGRRRFYLVAYRVDQRRPVVWFARDGFRGSPPPADSWFAATCEPTVSCLVTLPDPRLRRLTGTAADWPQPISLLLLADGGLLSVDIEQRRQRVLLPPCGLDSIYESPVCQFDVDREIEGERQRVEMPHRPVTARAGDQVLLVDRHEGTTRRLRLPAVLRGRPVLYHDWPDGSVAAIDSPPVVTGQMVSYGGVSSQPYGVPQKPLTAAVIRADGTLVRQQRFGFSPLVRYPVRRRALLVAACPLGLAWPGPARLGDEGVAQGLRWALGLQLVLALVVLLLSRSAGWAGLALVLGLPGWLAWLTHGSRRGARAVPGRPDWSRRPPGQGALWRLFVKDTGRLLPGMALICLAATRLIWTEGLAKQQLYIRGELGGSDGYVGVLKALPSSLSWVALVWAAWLTWHLVADERWAWLLTRRIDRRRALVAKLAAGLCSAALVGWVPLAVVGAYALRPGACRGPVTWVMVAPLFGLGKAALLACLVGAGCGLGWLVVAGRVSPVTLAWSDQPRTVRRWVVGAGAALLLLLPQPVHWPVEPKLKLPNERGAAATWELDVTQPKVMPPVGLAVNTDDQVVVYRYIDGVQCISGLDGPRVKDDSILFLRVPPRPAIMPASAGGGWIERLGSDTRAAWYLMYGPGSDRRYRLVAFDQRTWRRLGWLSRRGFTAERPRPEDSFDAADGGLVVEADGDEQRFVVADRGRLRRLGRGLGAGQTILELPGLCAFAQNGPGALVARSADRVVLPATDRLPARELRLPSPWRDLAWVARNARGQLVVADPSYQVDNSRRLLWLAADDRVVRRVVVDRNNGRRFWEDAEKGGR